MIKNSTVSELLHHGEELLLVAGISDTTQTASVLLSDASGIGYSSLVLKKEEVLEKTVVSKYYKYIEKAVTGIPLGYILGHQNFYGYDLLVSSSTLIPRPETEELVEKVLAVGWGGSVVIDVGTGSGCIPVVLRKKGDFLAVYACDISKDALEIAKKNASILDVFITFWESDCTSSAFVNELEKLHTQDVVHEYIFTANLPYIPSREMEQLDKNVRCFEPHNALDGGKHGTEIIIPFLENIMRFSKRSEKPIKFFLEIDPANQASLSSFFKKNKKWNADFIKDMSGHIRFVVGYID